MTVMGERSEWDLNDKQVCETVTGDDEGYLMVASTTTWMVRKYSRKFIEIDPDDNGNDLTVTHCLDSFINSDVTDNISVGAQEITIIGTESDDEDDNDESHRLCPVSAHGGNRSERAVRSMNEDAYRNLLQEIITQMQCLRSLKNKPV